VQHFAMADRLRVPAAEGDPFPCRLWRPLRTPAANTYPVRLRFTRRITATGPITG